MSEAEKMNAESEVDEMKTEFSAFCRMLLLLLKSGQIEEVKAELEKIIEQWGKANGCERVLGLVGPKNHGSAKQTAGAV